jgi:cell division cycle protein 37
MKDVDDTYDRIRERCQIMAAEKTQKPQPAKQVEQIQIEVTDPNMSLNVRIPDENSTDEEKANQLFKTLPVEFQEALKTKDITKINKVLGEMTVEEAEKVLQICGEADILSIEPGIIDTTQGEVVPGQELDEESGKPLVDNNSHDVQKTVS